MAKFVLELEPDLDFDVIGICSNHRDYRLCWALNSGIGLNLVKSDEDFMISGKKGAVSGTFSLYEFIDPETRTQFYLIKNKNKNETLLPELPQLDYVLVLRENFDIDPEDFIEKVKKVPSVQTAFLYHAEELKSASNLIF